MTRISRRISYVAIALLLILAPLPRRWPVFEYPFPGIFDEFTNFNLYFSDVATGLLFISAPFWLNWRTQKSIPHKAFISPLLYLVALTSASMVWAFDLLLSLQMAFYVVVLFTTTLLIVYLRPKQEIIQLSLAVTLLIQSVTAILQFSRQDDLGLQMLGELDLAPLPGGNSILDSGSQLWLRAYGLTPHPNILGGVSVICVLVLMAVFLNSRFRLKVLWLAPLLAGTAGLFLSFSRSAWLAGSIGATFFYLVILSHPVWRRTYRRDAMLLIFSNALLLTVLAWHNLPILLSRFNPASTPLETRAIEERNALRDAGNTLFQLSPLTGIGARNSTVAMIPLVSDTPNVTPQAVHNVPLLISVELGAGGGFLWLWLMLAPIVIALKRLRQDRLTLWALGLTSAIIAYGVIDLFDHYAWSWAQGRVLRWVLWGLWIASLDSECSE